MHASPVGQHPPHAAVEEVHAVPDAQHQPAGPTGPHPTGNAIVHPGSTVGGIGDGGSAGAEGSGVDGSMQVPSVSPAAMLQASPGQQPVSGESGSASHPVSPFPMHSDSGGGGGIEGGVRLPCSIRARAARTATLATAKTATVARSAERRCAAATASVADRPRCSMRSVYIASEYFPRAVRAEQGAVE